jgi:hypothetical protein
MATEGHGHGGNKNHQQQRKDARDKELTEIRVRMEELAMQMQQDTKSRWVYEWLLRRKVKWPVREFLTRRQWRLFKGWLRHAENLNEPEEEVVHVCEPEDGRNINDDDELRSLEDLMNYQEGRDEISNCQVGNGMRSLEGLIECQEDSEGILYC